MIPGRFSTIMRSPSTGTRRSPWNCVLPWPMRDKAKRCCPDPRQTASLTRATARGSGTTLRRDRDTLTKIRPDRHRLMSAIYYIRRDARQLLPSLSSPGPCIKRFRRRLGEFSRFHDAPQLMAYARLVAWAESLRRCESFVNRDLARKPLRAQFRSLERRQACLLRKTLGDDLRGSARGRGSRRKQGTDNLRSTRQWIVGRQGTDCRPDRPQDASGRRGSPMPRWKTARCSGTTGPTGAPDPARSGPGCHEFEIGCTLEHAGYGLSWLVSLFGAVGKGRPFPR